MDTPVGAVLTGGGSRRMGRTKALVPYRGEPLAARVAGAMHDGGCDPVVLVGGDVEELAVLNLPMLADRWPGQGPLGGVISALGAGGDADVVVAACDLAGLHGGAVRRMVEAPPAGVAVAFGRRRHPTLGRWTRDVASELEAIFAAGERSLMGALDALEAIGVPVVHVQLDERQLRNVNTPDDLAC